MSQGTLPQQDAPAQAPAGAQCLDCGAGLTGPYCAALGAAHVYIGGEFTRINDLPQPGVAQFPGTP